uniref:Uncharacterized protein n=1 Tax=Podoviridae sp. ct8Lf7 TaxID=2827723 RepID=A0A8S5S0N7_9CAUD|nr:MAG TPA: hypothetical protein [Podoviridae sp. ct8Lf7]
MEATIPVLGQIVFYSLLSYQKRILCQLLVHIGANLY